MDSAYNGKQAIEKVTQKNYNLVFMDVNMPEMDGLEATQHIIEMQEIGKINKDLKVIIVTAFNEVEDKKQAFEVGACAYLSKPVNVPILYKTLVEVLRDYYSF